jgi:hypothetical protein
MYASELHREVQAAVEAGEVARIGAEELSAMCSIAFGKLVDASLAYIEQPDSVAARSDVARATGEFARIGRGQAELLAARRFNFNRAARMANH